MNQQELDDLNEKVNYFNKLKKEIDQFRNCEDKLAGDLLVKFHDGGITVSKPDGSYYRTVIVIRDENLLAMLKMITEMAIREQASILQSELETPRPVK